MRVKRIDLDKSGTPSGVTVRLSASEALYLTLLLGRQNALSAEAVMTGGAEISDQLYDGLAGEVFNRYWDDGAADALAEHAARA